MKKLSLLFSMMIICLMFSCEQQEIAIPQEEEEALPIYDETNTTPVAWDDLPEELKNAIPLETNSAENPTTESFKYDLGPWGNPGGTPFNIQPNNDLARIYAIAIQSGAEVNRLVVWYINPDKSIHVGGSAGGNGGTYHYRPFSDGEYIFRVHGYLNLFLGVVNRLAIYTNKQTIAYGSNTGRNWFNAQVPADDQILGFFGSSRQKLKSIGFKAYDR